jgi:hypothetical protein
MPTRTDLRRRVQDPRPPRRHARARALEEALADGTLLERPRPIQRRRRHRWPSPVLDNVDTSQPGVSASDHRKFPNDSGRRNVNLRSGRKQTYELETSSDGKPSRKSTRKSHGRAKTASNLTRRQQRRTSAPKVRATRARSKQPAGTL